MCTEESDTGRRARKKPEEEITVNQLLSAISETEYPQYILEAIGKVQEWMKDMTTRPEEPLDERDIFATIFGEAFGEEDSGIEGLFERLDTIEEFADVIPNQRMPEGKPDTLIISITPPEYDSGIRTAIDYAAVFNRATCRRVWIISDTFIFDEVIKFVPHVDALAAQGIMLRYILVTPWGWVEMPLSGASASRHSLLWHGQQERTNGDKPRTRRRKEQ
ncbi:MAG: hypothetical protein II954_03280 [Synergistaceae bacterium]|nr:hypothetical protein [Synergistaceae bacterium]